MQTEDQSNSNIRKGDWYLSGLEEVHDEVLVQCEPSLVPRAARVLAHQQVPRQQRRVVRLFLHMQHAFHLTTL